MTYDNFETSVGKTVGIMRQHSSTGKLLMSRFGTVTKINGHGHIFVESDNKEYRFTRRGDAYNDKYGPTLVSEGVLRYRIKVEERHKAQAQTARAMQKELDNGFSNSGRFYPTSERIARLKDLLSKMEELVDT